MSSLIRRAALVALPVLLIAAAPAAAERYVALGDSYSSGTGTRDYSINSGCQRGPYAYPALIDVQRPNTELTFVACGGAQTSNVLSSRVSRVTSTTAIVTITIGGNDAGFSDVIVECAKPSWASNCSGRVTTAQNFIRNTLPGRLNNVYAAIESRAPNATVVVLGYPRIFMGEDCNAGTFFSGDDMTRLNATADLLRDDHARRAQAYGFTFKDAIPPFVGHAVCSSTEWLNGLSNPTSESYHPIRTGHSVGYAPLVRAVIGWRRSSWGPRRRLPATAPGGRAGAPGGGVVAVAREFDLLRDPATDGDRWIDASRADARSFEAMRASIARVDLRTARTRNRSGHACARSRPAWAGAGIITAAGPGPWRRQPRSGRRAPSGTDRSSRSNPIRTELQFHHLRLER